MAKEVKNEEVKAEQEQFEENQNQAELETKKGKIKTIIKAAAYGAAFVVGGVVVLILSHLGDKDEPEKKDETDDIPTVEEIQKKIENGETLEF